MVKMTGLREKHWKVSYYTHLFTYADGLKLAYNSLRDSITELSGPAGERLPMVLQAMQSPLTLADEEIRLLVKDGHLIEQDISELSVIRETPLKRFKPVLFRLPRL